MATAVLAVQGAFAEHLACLRELGEAAFELRQAADLSRPFDRLVLPGGESTVQAKLLRDLGLFGPLRERIAEGMPVLGTCAGLILLARATADDRAGCGDLAGRDVGIALQRCAVEPFRTLDVTVRRNAYGRQLGSFHAEGALEASADGAHILPMTFIRAPRIERVGPNVKVLARVGDVPVAVQQANQLGVAFHPELDDDPTLHRMLLGL